MSRRLRPAFDENAAADLVVATVGRGPPTTLFHTSSDVTVLRFTRPGSRKLENWLTGEIALKMPVWADVSTFVVP
jgi:hypothetical protein